MTGGGAMPPEGGADTGRELAKALLALVDDAHHSALSRDSGWALYDLRRVRELEAEVERLRAALDDLLDRQYEFPTYLSPAHDWCRAFDRAKVALRSPAGPSTDEDKPGSTVPTGGETT